MLVKSSVYLCSREGLEEAGGREINSRISSTFFTVNGRVRAWRRGLNRVRMRENEYVKLQLSGYHLSHLPRVDMADAEKNADHSICLSV